MKNSDYLIRATVKKLSEKLNQTFIDKIEKTSSAAQEVPELLKKELDQLFDEILQEAKRMEMNNDINTNSNLPNSDQHNHIKKAQEKIYKINSQLEILNKKLGN